MRMIDSAAGDPHGAPAPGGRRGSRNHTPYEARPSLSLVAHQIVNPWFTTVSPSTSHSPRGRPLVHGASPWPPEGPPVGADHTPPTTKTLAPRPAPRKRKPYQKPLGSVGCSVLFGGGCTGGGSYTYVSGLFCGVWTPVWGRGSPWVPPLVEASLPCSRFVVCATAPAPLGFCAGGGCPSDGRF
jgi:hypothetical protein